MRKKPEKRTAKVLSTAISVLIWIVLWQALSNAAKRAGMSLLLPSPLETMRAFAELLTQKNFYTSCGRSLLRVIVGWLTGLCAGSLLGIFTSIFKPLKTFFAPVLHIVKATPVASFIIAALVLMSSKKVPSFTGFLISLPIVWTNITEGISAPDSKLIEAAHFFNVKKKEPHKVYLYSRTETVYRCGSNDLNGTFMEGLYRGRGHLHAERFYRTGNIQCKNLS